MPREIKRRQRGRKQVRDQETFDFSTPAFRGSARATDPYVKQTDNRAANIGKFMDQFKQTASMAMQAHDLYAKGQEEKGQTSALKGEEAPESASWQFMQGYETVGGNAHIATYEKGLRELFSSSQDLSPREWEDQVDAYTRSTLNGRSDPWIDAFVPKAINLEAKYNEKFVDQAKAKVLNDYGNKSQQIAEGHLTLTYNNENLTKEQKAASMQSMVAGQQQMAKKLGIADKNFISQMVLDYVSKRAETDGRPDYLDYATIEDKDGFKLTQSPKFQDKLWQSLKRSDDKKTTMGKKVIEDNEKAEKEAIEDIERGIVISLESGNLQEAADLIGKHAGDLSSEKISAYMKRANMLHLDSSYALEDNRSMYLSYLRLATDGKMTEEIWKNAHQNLTKKTWIELSKMDSKAKVSRASDSTGSTSMYTNMRKSTMNMVAAPDPITGGFEKEEDYAKYNVALNKWYELKSAHQQGGGKMDYAGAKQIQKDVMEFMQSIDKDGGEGTITQKQASVAQLSELDQMVADEVIKNKQLNDAAEVDATP